MKQWNTVILKMSEAQQPKVFHLKTLKKEKHGWNPPELTPRGHWSWRFWWLCITLLIRDLQFVPFGIVHHLVTLQNDSNHWWKDPRCITTLRDNRSLRLDDKHFAFLIFWDSTEVSTYKFPVLLFGPSTDQSRTNMPQCGLSRLCWSMSVEPMALAVRNPTRLIFFITTQLSGAPSIQQATYTPGVASYELHVHNFNVFTLRITCEILRFIWNMIEYVGCISTPQVNTFTCTNYEDLRIKTSCRHSHFSRQLSVCTCFFFFPGGWCRRKLHKKSTYAAMFCRRIYHPGKSSNAKWTFRTYRKHSKTATILVLSISLRQIVENNKQPVWSFAKRKGDHCCDKQKRHDGYVSATSWWPTEQVLKLSTVQQMATTRTPTWNVANSLHQLANRLKLRHYGAKMSLLMCEWLCFSAQNCQNTTLTIHKAKRRLLKSWHSHFSAAKFKGNLKRLRMPSYICSILSSLAPLARLFHWDSNAHCRRKHRVESCVTMCDSWNSSKSSAWSGNEIKLTPSITETTEKQLLKIDAMPMDASHGCDVISQGLAKTRTSVPAH